MLSAKKILDIAQKIYATNYVRSQFDREFYLRVYSDVAVSGMDPVRQYIFYGADEGRNPRPDFNTNYYLSTNPDVRARNLNPLYHYLRYGKNEGRLPAPPLTDLSAPAAPDPQPPQLETNVIPLASSLPEYDWQELQIRCGLDIARLSLYTAHTQDVTLAIGKSDIPTPSAPLEVDTDFVNHVAQTSTGKLLSLDIWDTILRRNCHPDETKLRAARAFWLKIGGNHPHIKALHPIDLFQMRRIAEAMAADDNFEYRFADVAKIWLDLAKVPDQKLSQTLLEQEMAVEKSASYADATMTQIIAQHDGPVIAISDFYLSAKNLRALLEHNNVRLSGQVYASCDEMRTKREGSLFDYVLKTENWKPHNIVHMGDRRDADVEIPRIRGLSSVLYESPVELTRATEMAARMWTHVDGNIGPHSRALLATALDGKFPETAKGNPLDIESLAVSITGFVMQVLEEAIQRDAETVHFFTREGVFLKDIYDDLVAQDVFDLGTYPTSHILEVSRRATFAASLETFSTSEMMRLWSLYSTQSLEALAVTLNINPTDWAAGAARHGLTLSEQVQYPWQDSRVNAFFEDQDIKSSARHALSTQRKALLTYLETAGFDPLNTKSRVIVDIGWRGTIQDNISRICAGQVHGCYLGLDQFLNPQPINASKSGFLMDKNVDEDPFTISEYAALEYIFNSLGGSVIGYENGVAQRQIIKNEENVIQKHVIQFQSRIRTAAARVISYVRNHGLVSQDLRPIARAVIQDYVSNPAKDAAQAFVALEHNETFGTGSSDDMQELAAQFQPLETQNSADFHGHLTDIVGNLRWLEAHQTAGALSGFMPKRNLEQRLATPLRLSAPALLPASQLNNSRVCIFSPQPIKGSGGHRTIYNVARRLSTAGYDVHLMNEHAGSEDAMQWQGEVLAASGVHLHNAWNSSLNPNASIATIDYSASYVREYLEQHSRNFYFIQDYEAQFNPVGDVYLRSQRSYAEGLHAITIGRWLSHVLRVQYGIGAASGGLGVDHAVYRPLSEGQDEKSSNNTRRKRIAFLHQPEKFRRAPQLCVEALALVKARMPEVEIVTYGSEHHPHLPFPAHHRGLIKDLNAINEIYNECELGLCISATNPSRIPFEMMAAGCIPVDLYTYNNLFDYGNGCGVLAFQSPQSLAAAMCKVLEEDTWRNQRKENGLAYVKNRSLAWETDVAVNTVSHVLEGGTLSGLPHPSPSYTEKAVLSENCRSDSSEAYVAWQWKLATS